MQHFSVPDMSCDHCVKTITQAIKALDPAAKVVADLAQHTVAVASAIDAERLSAAIAAAG